MIVENFLQNVEFYIGDVNSIEETLLTTADSGCVTWIGC